MKDKISAKIRAK